MALKVVFFGNSDSSFSLRHFQVLLKENVELLGIVDSPQGKRGSTNRLPPGLPGLRDMIQGTDIPIYEPESPNDADFVRVLARNSPDLFVAVGYSHILKEPILSVPKILAANFHASLLPRYRGKHPVFWCLRNGERYSGLTVHAMDPGIDTGDILFQIRVRVYKRDTVESLYDRIIEQSLSLISPLIQECDRGLILRVPQPASGGSYFSSVHDEDFRISWSIDAETIRRSINITPGRCFIHLNGIRCFVADATVVANEHGCTPGRIMYVGNRRGVVGARDRGVSITRVKPEGLPTTSFADCLRKFGYRVGETLAG
jgi:methionyl-tRNA formyltransferase